MRSAVNKTKKVSEEITQALLLKKYWSLLKITYIHKNNTDKPRLLATNIFT
ncbi:hypothetical protein GCM10008918_02780 [Lactobacillus kefiranofaciens subsp. kefiranofaciens]